MLVAHHKIVQLMQIKYFMEFKKTKFSKQANVVLFSEIKKKDRDKALIKVIKEQRRLIEQVKSNPLTSIFMWFKKRKEMK